MSTIPKEVEEKEIEIVKGLEHNTITRGSIGLMNTAIKLDRSDIPLKCYICDQVTDKVILIIEKQTKDMFGFKSIYYCKTCFKNFLNT